MLYKPDKNKGIIPENEFTKRIAEVTNELAPYTRNCTVKNGKIELACSYILAENAKANVVFVHGFTEFREKYTELAYYFLNSGFSVFVYDQRGHGDSTRETEDLSVTHINRFEDYADDLECVISKAAEPNLGNAPLYLFAHSMGCAVAVLYMQRHPEKVKKAVLSSPMVKPKTHGVPAPFVLYAAKKYAKADGWEAAFRNTKKSGEPPKFNDDKSLSPARFRNLIYLHTSSKNRQISSPSNLWLSESIKVHKKVLDKAKNRKISAKVLILRAELDSVVRPKPQTALAKTLNDCKIITVKNAKHTMFTCCNSVLSDYLAAVFEFLSGNI